MFDRVEMDVVDMPGEIDLVVDEMFPIPVLPDSSLAPAAAAGIARPGASDGARETGFNERSAQRIVRIMLRQDDHRDDVEGMRCPHLAHRGSQCSDVPYEQIRFAVRQVDGEETGSAQVSGSSITHAASPSLDAVADVGPSGFLRQPDLRHCLRTDAIFIGTARLESERIKVSEWVAFDVGIRIDAAF
ncbi:MAG: hypothetical protein HY749_03120 [Gammaproteobacteria bacterium]|nr:hypothetical protein [Gammaproteobacteria bacterium]